MNSHPFPVTGVEQKIYLIRGQRVMLDFDLAELYQVPTKQLNQQVRRNSFRFPADFMFTLTDQEVVILRSQIVTSSLAWGGTRYSPLAFTEQGIAMLSSVLKSRRAKYDGQFKLVFDAIRQIVSEHGKPRKQVKGLGT